MSDPTESTLQFTDERDLLEEAKDRDLLAAGPWREGTPAETSLFLVEVRNDDKDTTFISVAVYDHQPMGRGGWLQWTGPDFDEVIRYAPIHT